MSGVGSSPALATCEKRQVLHAGVSGGLPKLLPVEDTDRVSKGSDDPVKSHNIYDALSEEGMEAETTPASPRKGHIERLPIT